MALKDWKKLRPYKISRSFFNTFENKKNKHYFIQVYRNNSFNPPYRFTIHKNGRFVSDKLFKTRSQAMTYAKNYMRMH